MKRSISGFLMVVGLALGAAFVASAVFSTQSVANGGYAPPSSDSSNR